MIHDAKVEGTTEHINASSRRRLQNGHKGGEFYGVLRFCIEGDVFLIGNRRESLPSKETLPLTDTVARVFTASIFMLAARAEGL